MRKTLILISLWLISFSFTKGQSLSEGAEISVITCGPYQGELYSAFGHNAFRIKDPQRGMDYVYDYGVFDFDQPNFYLNFARGFMVYKLNVSNYGNFVRHYIEEDRYVHEQVLNLSPEQEQRIFEFLQWNARPENAQYYYDYFYDNCATRMHDVVKETLGEEVKFYDDHITTDYSLRDLMDMYLDQQPWGDLGIDICLGLPVDKKATPDEYMFLPDYVEAAFDNAAVVRNGREYPLVSEKNYIHKVQKEEEAQERLITPFSACVTLLIIGLIWTFAARKLKKAYFIFDVVLFSVTGLVGWLLLLLWAATNHDAAAYNFNLLWAIPFYFPVALWLPFSQGRFLRLFFLCTSIIGTITLISWPWLPQDLPDAVIPLVILLVLRGFIIQKRMRSSKPSRFPKP